MSIVPLPVFEVDADPAHRNLTDEEMYERLESPKTVVVRFGAMKLIGEYPYSGDAKPGCGTKLVARTHRGTELVEMLTTTCENAGCSKSVTRNEMREYIDNSGGRDYPFYNKGRILRVATIEDLNRQSELASMKREHVRTCKRLIGELELDMKLVEVEPILGGELLTFYYTSQERVDFRELVRQLAAACKARIEMRQVGARDEARLVADYERCGQYCCCKGFLKVLKPISMRSAKLQKATLDPLKISGRCGRLMCCLRYEDQTYTELKKNLPHRKTRVGTPEGPGIVLDGRILTQLVLVRLEADQREIAVPVEELGDPDAPIPVREEPDPLRGMSETDVATKAGDESTPPQRRRRRRRRRGKGKGNGEAGTGERPASQGSGGSEESEGQAAGGTPASEGGAPKKRRRRRRRGGRGRGGSGGSGNGGSGGGSGGSPGA